MLYCDCFRSSAAFRCRIAFKMKGLAPERRFVHLRRAERRAADYLALNPQGLVPALVLDDGAVLTQSLAIMEFLKETRPEPPLLPADAEGRARVRALALAIACEIHPLNNRRVLAHVSRTFGIGEAERTEKWYRHWIAVGLAGVERLLAGSADTGRHCHGDKAGLADCCLVPQVFNAIRFECDLSPYPTLMRVHEACIALDAFVEAESSRQPDSE